MADRWKASILDTGVGPRLMIDDSRPAGRIVTSSRYMDLPVQLSRYTETTLYVRETCLESRDEHLTGDSDDIDDLIAQLTALRVHRLHTLRPIDLWDGVPWAVTDRGDSTPAADPEPESPSRIVRDTEAGS